MNDKYLWGKPGASRKWHIFGSDGMCLCRAWGMYGGSHPDDTVSIPQSGEAVKPRPGDCAACVRAFNGLLGRKPEPKRKGKVGPQDSPSYQ